LPIRLLSMMLPKCSRWHRYTRFVFGFTSSSYVRGAADDAAHFSDMPPLAPHVRC
jgi:hypothetical protein